MGIIYTTYRIEVLLRSTQEHYKLNIALRFNLLRSITGAAIAKNDLFQTRYFYIHIFEMKLITMDMI